MATEEHKYLADIIKTTHATLREETQKYGAEIAWKRHVSRKDILQKYASSMEKLATTYWKANNVKAKYATFCRVEWIKSQCEEYFWNHGKEQYDEREKSIRLKIGKDLMETKGSIKYCKSNTDNEMCCSCKASDKFCTRVTLLDVGSCYNPFGTLSMFDVTAIDLNSIPNRVLRCDFLNVCIGTEKIVSSDEEEILQLPENSYDVVVFSLFLEYLPCSKQRYLCCEKAYHLLRSAGILFIVSPDSKHTNANAKLIKSWRYVLSKLGFMRIKYEKLRHIHCIAFRKCIFKEVAVRWATLQTVPKDDPLYQDNTVIYIPQDFHNVSGKIKQPEKENYDTDQMTFLFGELPFNGI